MSALAKRLDALRGSDDAFSREPRFSRLFSYQPYKKQMEFHAAGSHYRERMLMAPNKVGKTHCAAGEIAMHLTGIYPMDWPGLKFENPIVAIVASKNAKMTRDGAQCCLFGEPQSELGTGMIPASMIGDTPRGGALSDCYDFAKVRHISGDWSIIYFRSYDQGRERIQSYNANIFWFDEEPSEEIYFEGISRTNAHVGPIMLTATPLLGISNVVRRFYLTDQRPSSCSITEMTLEDAKHFSSEQREIIISSYPDYEREARAFGRPAMGSGAVFAGVSRESIEIEPIEIPKSWALIGGIDFGGPGDSSHPTAGVKLAHDRDADVVYVIAEYAETGRVIYQNAVPLKAWGQTMPWAWPHDGLREIEHANNSAEKVKNIYIQHGLNMLESHATFEDGTFGVNAGIDQMIERMQTGRFKVFRHLSKWWQEFTTFHRKNGIVVKENDDLMSATRYAIMMIRYAESGVMKKNKMAEIHNEWV